MRRSWIMLLAGSLIGCGATRQGARPDSASGDPAVAGSASGGSSSGAGPANGGRAGTPSLGGSAVGGVSGASNRLACSSPYIGPEGGPRTDGPQAATYPCADTPDDVILQRYDDFEARVPQGSYYEVPTANIIWGEQCSNGVVDILRHADGLAGVLIDTWTTPWFYEAEFCDGERRRLFRELRCDYFDGMTFESKVEAERTFLSSLLWWSSYGDTSDAVLLGYTGSIGDVTDTIETCWLQTVHGDFGLCDEISLMGTLHAFEFDGGVTSKQPQVLRTLKGKCH